MPSALDAVERSEGGRLKVDGPIPAEWLAHGAVVFYALERRGSGWRAVSVTPNIETLTGDSPAEACAAGWWKERLHPEDRARLLERQSALFDSESLADDYRFRHRAGHHLWIRDQRRRVDGPTGPLVVGTWVDISDFKQAEAELAASESSYRNLFHSVSDAIYVQDEQGRFLDVNEGAQAMYGYPRERFVGETPEFLSAPGRNDLAAVAQAVGRALAGEPQRFEFWGLRSNGEVFPKEVRLFPARSHRHPIVLAIAQDISERKRAEAELRLLREAIDQTGEIVLISDREATIQYVNRAFEHVTGYAREEVLGQNTRILKSGAQSSELYRELWQTITSGRVWSGRLVNRRKDGSRYTEEVSISPVFDDEGRIVNYVAVKRDITSQLQLQERFQQAQKMESVGRLAGGVAHDFNNMLSVVLGYGELALEHVRPEGPAREFLDQILLAAERSRELVRQLLTFARRQPIEPRILDLNEVIGSTGRLLRGLLREDVRLHFDLAPDLWSVRVDPGQIDQILSNLIVNARDAMPEGGEITVATRNVVDGPAGRQDPAAPSAELVMLSVTDTGLGMDRPTLERLFEPFFTTKEAGSGTGLGLATVYGIVQQNDGRIDVESAPGGGTSFRIYLPRSEGTAAAEAPSLPEVASSNSETILLVEDNAALLELTRALLVRLGYRVIAAASPAEAREQAERARGEVDLLLTDVIMPETNGRELADQLRALQPKMRVLFMSGYSADIIAERGILEEDVHFLQKPFKRTALATKVRAALES